MRILYPDPNNQSGVTRKYWANFHQNEHGICLASNTCYNWEVTDSYPDGFAGSYKLFPNGNEIVSGIGDFLQSRTEQICTGNLAPSPTNPPVPSPDDTCGGNAKIQFQLELYTENYGAESSWFPSLLLDEDPTEVASQEYAAFAAWKKSGATFLILSTALAMVSILEITRDLSPAKKKFRVTANSV